jgi:hypothetical protein
VNAKVCPMGLSLATNCLRTKSNHTEAVISRRRPRDNHSTSKSDHKGVSSFWGLEETQKMMV